MIIQEVVVNSSLNEGVVFFVFKEHVVLPTQYSRTITRPSNTE